MSCGFCFECGGELVRQGGAGRKLCVRQGCTVILPEDFPIPTCQQCGAEFMSEDDQARAVEVVTRMMCEGHDRDWWVTLWDIFSDALKESGRSVRDVAASLPGYSAYTLSRVLMRGDGITAQLAEQLAEHVGYAPGFWLKAAKNQKEHGRVDLS